MKGLAILQFSSQRKKENYSKENGTLPLWAYMIRVFLERRALTKDIVRVQTIIRQLLVRGLSDELDTLNGCS